LFLRSDDAEMYVYMMTLSFEHRVTHQYALFIL